MPNGYRSQPITGFTGYIPGAKWQVGSKYVPPSYSNAERVMNDDRMELEQARTRGSDGYDKMSSSDTNTMKNFSEMSNEELREQLQQMQMNMQQLQLAMSAQREERPIERDIPGNARSSRRVERMDEQSKQRSKSVPKKVESNPFDGVESGWWSKGEVQRNKERREIADSGYTISGGNFEQRPPSRKRQSRRFEMADSEENDIPAAGYSGHIQGLRQIGVGKSFNTAAKQAKKEYIERRRTYSGSRDILNNRMRGVQYSDEEVLNNTVKLPDNRF
ncbi:unnamed protein product [Caenorhabditis bovis]|uniref:Uncharacterized protein n=1 Tax=Caenorhabditis bovis TaxID=2654633 RepID=A0A8S1E6W7_9PELO|nr:unnamed protein product [Caenorhabditis bovis]